MAPTLKLPYATIERWMTTLERGIIHRDASFWGNVLVKPEGAVLVEGQDGVFRRAVGIGH